MLIQDSDQLGVSTPLYSSAARLLEHERIGDDHDAAAFRRRERPAANRFDDALLGFRITQGRARERRGLNLARRRDDELHLHATLQVGALVELLLIAELHLVHVALDDAADDFLRERAAHVRLAAADERNLGLA